MLIFQGDTLGQLSAYAELAYPRECCGIMLGRQLEKQRIVFRIIPTPNMARENETATHFLINPLAVAKAEMLAENSGLAIIGFYHSHPDCAAVLSNADMIGMIAGYSYPIVSVQRGICAGINSFEKRKQTDAQARKEEILIKEKNYADFGIHISNAAEFCQSKSET